MDPAIYDGFISRTQKNNELNTMKFESPASNCIALALFTPTSFFSHPYRNVLILFQNHVAGRRTYESSICEYWQSLCFDFVIIFLHTNTSSHIKLSYKSVSHQLYDLSAFHLD